MSKLKLKKFIKDFSERYDLIIENLYLIQNYKGVILSFFLLNIINHPDIDIYDYRIICSIENILRSYNHRNSSIIHEILSMSKKEYKQKIKTITKNKEINFWRSLTVILDLNYNVFKPVLHFTYDGENLKYIIPNSIFYNEQAFYYMMEMALKEKYEELKLYLELMGGERFYG